MVIAAIVGYLLGSIPTGRRNAHRFSSRGSALAVVVADLLKGLGAAVVGSLLWGPWWWAYVAVFFAMIGQALPLFTRSRGQLSVSTCMGGMVILTPLAVATSVLAGLVLALALRRFAVGVGVAVLCLPLSQLLFDPRAHAATTALCVMFLGLQFALPRFSNAPEGPRGATSPA